LQRKKGIYEENRKFPILAGAVGIEPTAYGFGDGPTSRPVPLIFFEVQNSNTPTEN